MASSSAGKTIRLKARFLAQEKARPANRDEAPGRFSGSDRDGRSEMRNLSEAFHASGKDDVYVGRLHHDSFVKYELDLWGVADNLRKGAVLNNIQIAEELI